MDCCISPETDLWSAGKVGQEKSHSFEWTPQPWVSAPLFLQLGSQGPQASLRSGKAGYHHKDIGRLSGFSAHWPQPPANRGLHVLFWEWISCQSSPRKDEVSLHLLLCNHPAWLPLLWLASLDLVGEMPPCVLWAGTMAPKELPVALAVPSNSGSWREAMHQPSENRCAHKLICPGGWEMKGLHSWSCSSRRPKDLSCWHILSFLPGGHRVYFWELSGLPALCSFDCSGKPQQQPPPSTFSRGSAQLPAPTGASLVHSFYIVALDTYIPGTLVHWGSWQAKVMLFWAQGPSK